MDYLGPFWLLFGIIAVVLLLVDFLIRHHSIALTKGAMAVETIVLVLGCLLGFTESWIPFGITLVIFIGPLYFEGKVVQRAQAKQQKQLIKEGKLLEFTTTRKFGLLRIDDGRGLYSTDKKAYKIEDLISAELVEGAGHSNAKHKGSVSRGVLGGALFGVAGAVIGSSTAKSIVTKTVGSLYVNVETRQGPHRVTLINTDTKRGGFVETRLQQIAEETINGFNVLLLEKKEVNGTTESSGDFASELRQLNSLLEDGIITQDDFDQKKAQILNLSK